MWMRIISTAALFTVAGFAAGSEATGRNLTTAPVLRGSEPSDSGVLTLPAPPAPPAPLTPAPAPPVSEAPPAHPVRTEVAPPPPAPVAPPRDLQPPAVPPSAVPPPVPSTLPKSPRAIHAGSTTVVSPPAARTASKLFLPADFEHDSATYCQKRIGEWTEPDVYNLFGDPLRQRTAPNDGKKEDSGRILAFSDPTGRYREIELDFAPDTGLLRSVFIYPWQMTWQECRRLWDGDVSSTRANKGRIFYSYVNRRLDVLVDSSGKVISFGLY